MTQSDFDEVVMVPLPAVLPVFLTTRMRTPGVGAVFVTMFVPVGWNGTLQKFFLQCRIFC